jgi:hypothetical protein
LSTPFQILRQNRVTAAVVSAFLLLLVFILWNILEPQTDARIEAICKRGYPASLAELDGWYKPVPESENAALRYMEAFALPAFIEKPGETFMTSSWPPRGRTLTERDHRELMDLVADDQTALQLLHAAQAFNRSRYPIDLKQGALTLLPHLSKLKRAVSLLAAEAVLAAADGNTEGATKAVLAAGHAADSVAEEPILISQLLRMACWGIIESRLERVLNLTTLPGKELALLQKMFSEAESRQGFLRGLVGEQASGIAFFSERKQQNELFPGASPSSSGRWQQLPTPIFIGLLKTTGLFQKDKAFYLDVMAANIAAAEVPFPARVKQSQLTAGMLPPGNRFYIISRIILPALSRAFTRDADAVARLRVAQAVLAVERFRLSHGGVLPSSLEELVPTYLSSVPADPYDGKPLRFKRSDSSYVIYSIGSDGTDNGGIESTAKNRAGGYDITFTVER